MKNNQTSALPRTMEEVLRQQMQRASNRMTLLRRFARPHYTAFGDSRNIPFSIRRFLPSR